MGYDRMHTNRDGPCVINKKKKKRNEKQTGKNLFVLLCTEEYFSPFRFVPTYLMLHQWYIVMSA